MREQQFLKEAEKIGIEKIQITKTRIQEDSVTYLNEKRKRYEISDNTSYTVKAEKEKKTVKLKTNYLDSDVLETLQWKFKNIESLNEDLYLTDTTNNNEEVSTTSLDIHEIFPKLEKVSKLKDQNPLISKIEQDYIETKKQLRIINNLGVDINTSSHTYTYITEIATHKEEKDVVARKVLKSTTSEIDFVKIAKEEIQEAVLRLEEKNLKTGKYKVLLQNKMASKLISSIMRALNAEDIQKEASLYQGKINQQIASTILNIIEDPKNQNYPGYTLFDQEGTKTMKKDVIKNGILKTYFYNNKTAIKDQTTSTGNEYGGINTVNLYVQPGEKDFNSLVKEMKNGVIITSYTAGLGAIKLENGNISIQIFGLYVEEGKIKGGIKPAILTTTFDEILSKLMDVGNDLTFTSIHTGSPSLLFDELNIASE